MLMYLFKNGVKYFSSIYVLRSKVCLCDSTVNFYDTLRINFHTYVQCKSINFYK